MYFDWSGKPFIQILTCIMEFSFFNLCMGLFRSSFVSQIIGLRQLGLGMIHGGAFIKENDRVVVFIDLRKYS